MQYYCESGKIRLLKLEIMANLYDKKMIRSQMGVGVGGCSSYKES